MTQRRTARDWIDALGLEPHPEGGYYIETYRSAVTMDAFGGTRNVSTGIYFLLEGDQFSALHRIKSDEMWHHYNGAPLIVHVIHEDGRYECISVGPDIAAGQRPQAVVPAGAWFGAEIDHVPGDARVFSLVGATVAPGFDFQDFEMAERMALISEYPAHRALIDRLTRC